MVLCSDPGVVHADLKLFLETSFPSVKKKAMLGVADGKIGAALQEELGVSIQTGGVVAEILRGSWLIQVTLNRIESFLLCSDES